MYVVTVCSYTWTSFRPWSEALPAITGFAIKAPRLTQRLSIRQVPKISYDAKDTNSLRAEETSALHAYHSFLYVA